MARAFLLALGSVIPLASCNLQKLTYGSLIQLENGGSDARLYSVEKMTWGGPSHQQVVTSIKPTKSMYDDTGTFWYVKHFDDMGADPSQKSFYSDFTGDVNGTAWIRTPDAGTAIECGAVIRLEHAETSKNLHSHLVRCLLGPNYQVSGFGISGEGDGGDAWRVECQEGDRTMWEFGKRVALRHVDLKGYLNTEQSHQFTDRNCPGCSIVGHNEVSVKVSSTPSQLMTWKAKMVVRVSKTDDETEAGPDDNGNDEL